MTEIFGSTTTTPLNPIAFSGSNSGVYVGSGDMPEGYNIQIDPNGDANETVATKEYVDGAIASVDGGEKQWTLLHDITLEEATNVVSLTVNCKEVYVEGILKMNDVVAGKTIGVFFQPTNKRLTTANIVPSNADNIIYMRGEITISPSGRLKGTLNIDNNSLGYTRTSVESTLSTNYVDANGNIPAIKIQLHQNADALMEIGSTIKVWGVL